ncbi:uncharacterized mitochondrial protein AtMg00240-like [Impatiens glandulifera]|uniref:uncharacterized mitochondrial protein AtMg00240-like n=1 Tax=Impatiens glandulifera TaxID=253017 RepID=UPI001FB125AC|nr:uncharacterized mitochondrial protein AtMg00240-like [Impatiens glandulifera]
MIRGIKLHEELHKSIPEPSRFWRLVGILLYLNYTRLDIAYVLQQLSQLMNEPSICHWEATLHVVRYLKGTAYVGTFNPFDNKIKLQAYADSDWGSCPLTRKIDQGKKLTIRGRFGGTRVDRQLMPLSSLIPNAIWDIDIP